MSAKAPTPVDPWPTKHASGTVLSGAASNQDPGVGEERCEDCGQLLRQPARPMFWLGKHPVWCAYCEDSRPVDHARSSAD